MKSAIIEAADIVEERAGYFAHWGQSEFCLDRAFYMSKYDKLMDLAQRLRAEASGWQPIETAPKDGTEIDVWCESTANGDNGGYRIPDSWWCQTDKNWRTHGDNRISWAHPPTHWMPLPAPPAVKESLTAEKSSVIRAPQRGGR